MCGIVYLKRKDNQMAVRSTLKRYEFQSGRGKQGFGFVAVSDNKVVEYQRDETETGIKNKLDKLYELATLLNKPITEILFHHRFPTSTPNTENTAHPIKVTHTMLSHDYYVVHNGVITNPTQLREYHEKLGFEYTTEVEQVSYVRVKYDSTGRKLPKSKRITEEIISTKFNDSEALAIELALWHEGHIPTVRATGTYAFVIFKVNKTTKNVDALLYGRKDNPLKLTDLYELEALTSLHPDKDEDNIEDGVMYMEYRSDTGELISTDEKRFIPKALTPVPYQNYSYGYGANSNSWKDKYMNKDDDREYGYHTTPVRRRCDTCQRELPLKEFPSTINEFTCSDCIQDNIYSRYGQDDDDDEVVGKPLNSFPGMNYSGHLYEKDKTDEEKTTEELVEEHTAICDYLDECVEEMDKFEKGSDEYWEWFSLVEDARSQLREFEAKYRIQLVV